MVASDQGFNTGWRWAYGCPYLWRSRITLILRVSDCKNRVNEDRNYCFNLVIGHGGGSGVSACRVGNGGSGLSEREGEFITLLLRWLGTGEPRNAASVPLYTITDVTLYDVTHWYQRPQSSRSPFPPHFPLPKPIRPGSLHSRQRENGRGDFWVTAHTRSISYPVFEAIGSSRQPSPECRYTGERVYLLQP